MEQKSKNYKGNLIAIEGVDGSGKTTLINNLFQYLRVKVKVDLTKEPGNNPIGRVHRDLSMTDKVHPYTAALISTADRYFKMESLLDKINHGFIILSDRYYLSGLAYHYADGIPFEEYAYLNRKALKPNSYIFLDVSLENARKRIQKAHDRWEAMLEKVYSCYSEALRFLKNVENASVVRLDANLSPDIIFNHALSVIQPLLRTDAK